MDILKQVRSSEKKTLEIIGEGRTLKLKNNLSDRHRPQSIQDMIVPERIKDEYKDEILKDNLILSGNFGRGKTTLAYILTKKFKLFDPNDRVERGMPLLLEVQEFCKVPYDKNGKPKAVFIDEADKLTPAFVDGLKTMLEHSGVPFIFCTNYYQKLEGGIKSRCNHTPFVWTPDEEKYLKSLLIEKYIKIFKEDYKSELTLNGAKYFVSVNSLDLRASLKQIESVVNIINFKKLPKNEEGLPIVDENVLSANMHKVETNNKEFYKILFKSNSEYEVAAYIKSNYMGNEDEGFAHLGLPLFDLLLSHPKFYPVYAAIVEDIAEYTYKSQTIPNKLVALLALGNVIFKKYKNLGIN